MSHFQMRSFPPASKGEPCVVRTIRLSATGAGEAPTLRVLAGVQKGKGVEDQKDVVPRLR